MPNTIIIKNSSTVSDVPTAGQLEQGELAINLLDEKLYSKNSSNVIFEIGAGGGADLAADETVTGTWTFDGPVTGSDFGTGGKVKDGTDVSRPIGFNVMPIYEIDVDDTFDLAHSGMLWHRDAGVAVNFTCNNDSTIPVGATYVVHNEGTDSIEITQGTANVQFINAGTAPTAGSVTVDQGGIVTVYKYSDTEFWVWGAKSTSIVPDIVEDLSDVLITSKALGDILRWNGSNWVDYADSNYSSSGHTHTLSSGATDVAATTAELNLLDISGRAPTAGWALLADSPTTASWQAIPGGITTLDGLSDTNITTPADGSLLIYDTGTATWRDFIMSGDASMNDSGVVIVANDSHTHDTIYPRYNTAETISGDWTYSQQPQMLYGIGGDYSTVGGATTYGATIWSLDTTWQGGAAGANSASTSVYGIRYLRSAHSEISGNIGEGLYVLSNGVQRGGIGAAGIWSGAAIVAATSIAAGTSLSAGTTVTSGSGFTNTALNSAFGYDISSNFAYDGDSIVHYGMTTYNDSVLGGGAAALSGFYGLRFFRTGLSKGYLGAAGWVFEDAVDVTGALTATSFGGITSGNLLDKTATEDVSGAYRFTNTNFGDMNVHRAHASNAAAIKYSNSSGTFGYLGMQTGNLLTLYDSAASPSGFTVDADSGALVANAVTINATGSHIKIDDTDDVGARYCMIEKNGAAFNMYYRDDASVWKRMFRSDDGGAGYLYHDGSQKLITASDGIDVTGDVGGTTIGGITEANLVDKSAVETISGVWTFTGTKTTMNQLFINESASADDDVASDGQFWVKDNIPNDAYFTNDIGVDYPLAYATYRRSSANVLDNLDQTLDMTTDSVADAMINGIWGKTTVTARTLTLEPSTDTQFPVGAQIAIYNRAASGDMTVTEGTGTTLYVLDGSAVTDAAGSATVGPGGYATLIRESTTIYLLMGAGVTP